MGSTLPDPAPGVTLVPVVDPVLVVHRSVCARYRGCCNTGVAALGARCGSVPPLVPSACPAAVRLSPLVL